MKVLIIYTYPDPTGFNSAILKQVQASIDKGHEMKVIDLYGESFDPVLRFDRHHKRRDLKDDPAMKPYRNDLLWADHVIFIYPIWWGGMPAILKGFIDRVFAKGFAYDYKGLIPVGYFKDKQATLITTDDTPWFYGRFFQEDYGRVMKKQVLKMSGFQKVYHLRLSFLRHTSEVKRQAMLEKVARISKKI